MAKPSSAGDAPVRPHTLTLNSRKALSLTGIMDVNAFDEKQIALQTEGGPLMIDGDGLHVTALLLDKGRVSIEGKINAMIYTGRKDGRKDLGGLFR